MSDLVKIIVNKIFTERGSLRENRLEVLRLLARQAFYVAFAPLARDRVDVLVAGRPQQVQDQVDLVPG